MPKFSLTIHSDNLEDLIGLAGGAATPAASLNDVDTNELIELLKDRLTEDGRTLVVRAARKSTKKVEQEEAPYAEPEEAPDDEAEDKAPAEAEDQAAEETEAAPEAAAEDDDDALDYETAIEAVQQAVTSGADPELAAKVRKSMGKFMSANPSVKKLSDLTTDADRAAFVAHVEADLPELFGEAGF
jgi:hypothetical protein